MGDRFRNWFKDLDESEYPLHLSPYLADGVPYIHAQFKKNGYVIKIKDDGLAKWHRHLYILSQEVRQDVLYPSSKKDN